MNKVACIVAVAAVLALQATAAADVEGNQYLAVDDYLGPEPALMTFDVEGAWAYEELFPGTDSAFGDFLQFGPLWIVFESEGSLLVGVESGSSVVYYYLDSQGASGTGAGTLAP